MPNQHLEEYHLILASGSPRRQDFFKGLHLNYTIDVRKTDESFPKHLIREEITDYIARAKAAEFPELQEKDILITSDTLVWLENEAIGKPEHADDAKKMLRKLSGKMHEVITSICFTSKNFQKTVSDITKVWFKPLSDEEIEFYVNTYKPFDKAGSYGIQEWIGYIGVEKIEGSYFNVMGLPTHLIYKFLSEEIPF